MKSANVNLEVIAAVFDNPSSDVLIVLVIIHVGMISLMDIFRVGHRVTRLAGRDKGILFQVLLS